MNDIVKLIKERRSVKSYSSKPVNADDLKVIVENGLWAPNGRNFQQRFFSVVSCPDMMAKMKVAIREVRGDDACEPFYGAPCVVYISADDSCPFSGLDAGASMENMIISASALGIDTCFMVGPLSLFDHKNADEFKKELGIPEGYSPVCALILGYRQEGVAPSSDRDMSKVKYI